MFYLVSYFNYFNLIVWPISSLTCVGPEGLNWWVISERNIIYLLVWEDTCTDPPDCSTILVLTYKDKSDINYYIMASTITIHISLGVLFQNKIKILLTGAGQWIVDGDWYLLTKPWIQSRRTPLRPPLPDIWSISNSENLHLTFKKAVDSTGIFF